MKISFVIPAHNEEYLIAGCLKTLLASIAGTNCDAEVIVVDNASTDRTAAIAASFSKVKVVAEPRKGLSLARHSGYLAASGDLIANVDADTLVPPEWIKAVLEEFAGNPQLAGLSGPFQFYDLPSWQRALCRIFYFCAYGVYVVNRFVLNTSSLLQGGNFIIRRTALDQIGGFNPLFTFYGEDTDVAKRLHRVGPVKFTLNLTLPSSGRRIREEGLFTMGARYALNHAWTILFRRPYTRQSQDIRANKAS